MAYRILEKEGKYMIQYKYYDNSITFEDWRNYEKLSGDVYIFETLKEAEDVIYTLLHPPVKAKWTEVKRYE